MSNNKSIPSDTNSYYKFSTFFSLHQFIKVPAPMKCNCATIIDHILASFPERVAQQYIVDVGLFDYQLIFCKREVSRIKRGTNKHIKFHLFKHYSTDIFETTLTSMNFPNCKRLLKHLGSTYQKKQDKT